MAGQGEVVKSAKRIFEVLEYFGVVRRPVSLKEVAVHLAYPVSSASALLKSMVTIGYLDYDLDSRTYMPTMKVAELGSWVKDVLFGEGQVLALVKHMSDTTGETITISTQSGLHAQYIYVVQSRHALRYHMDQGTIRPLGASGIGWLQLSARSDAKIEQLVRRINYAAGPDGRVDLSEVMARVRQIRRDGYVFSCHTVIQGAGIIAMLLPHRIHGRTLAIGAGGPVDRLTANKDEILDAMREGIAHYLPAGSQQQAE